MARKDNTGGTESVSVDGRTVRFTHPDKVLYQATGTTKSDVLDYFLAVAPLLITYAGGRPVTRKRWPDGTAEKSFFEKNLPGHTPDWVPRVSIEHIKRTVDYPVLDSPATLAWFAQQAALELHVPQWTLQDGAPGRTRRIVIDLDPGEGVELDTTAQVALLVRDLLTDAGLRSYPVTSGSKGIHVYARLDRAVSATAASTVAKQIAKSLEKQHPDLITATMKRSIRSGKVFLDWSQNSGSKTTVTPYSLRGRAEPWVAAPRTWEELGDGGLEHLHGHEVLARLDSEGDLLDGLEVTAGKVSAPRQKKSGGKKKSSSSSSSSRSSDDDDPERAATDHPTTNAVVASLDEYRRKRDRRRTPEPFEGEVDPERTAGDAPVFVIQEHHARRLHYDFRLARRGVLVSWAVPKNLPTAPRERRLAVNTEDHPLGYETFEGTIPRGEYGAGTVTVWDRGTYDCEKWDDDEIIVRLHGDRVSGRYVLVRTSAENRQWIVQYMRDQSPAAGGVDEPAPVIEGPGSDRPAAPPLPMIPTAADVTGLPDEKWVFEGKWDGYRVTVSTNGEHARMVSRNGNAMDWLTDGFPALGPALGRPAVLDGELVVLDSAGVPDFAALARQAGAEGTDASTAPVHLFAFDVLELDGVDLRPQPWTRRREVLDLLAPRLVEVPRVHVPGVLDGPGDRALAEAEEFGWEGVVAKRRDSRYESGRRTQSWLKQKLLTTTDAVVGGWRPGRGGLAGGLGSLLLGLPTGTGLTYIGRVGTGFTDRQRRAVLDELEPLRRKSSPFVGELASDIRRDANWVLPRLVVEVRHQGFTDDGHMRQPVWRDVRRDKLPGDL